MKKSHLLLGLLVIVLVVGLAFWLGRRSVGSMPAQSPAASTVSGEKKVLYWYDPMVPNTRFDKPGKSPFMDMQLVPMYDEPASDRAAVTIDSGTRQNLGIRTAVVTSGDLARGVDGVGYVEPDQQRIAVIQTRAQGWVERLGVSAVNDSVRRGQVLMEIYSPDLVAAQAEYLLAARHSDAPQARLLVTAARNKLALLGLTPAQIDTLARTQKINRRVAYRAPIGGVVSELNVRSGSQVSLGMTAMSLTDLSSVWVIAEIPEAQASRLRPGARVTANFAAYPQQEFRGSIDYVYPQVSQANRTLRARARFTNPSGLLKPGMYANVTLSDPAPAQVTLVPSEAIIMTGKRKVVILAEPNGAFRPVDVQTGPASGESTQILSGLVPGQRVVTSGQFLLDSESNMRLGLQRLEENTTAAEGQRQAVRYTARGEIKQIDRAAGSITLAHDAVPALKWSSMTMTFSANERALAAQVKPGQRVEFDFEPNDSGSYTVTAIRPDRAQ